MLTELPTSEGQIRYRLAWLMGLIVILAIFLGSMTSPLDPVPAVLLLVVVSTFFLFACYVVLAVMPYYLAIQLRRCPACGGRSLVLSTLILFRPPLASFHRCTGCGSRFK